MRVTIRRLRFFALGGLLLENFFTGFASILDGDYAATTRSYLWMPFIYALGGELLWRLQRDFKAVAVPLFFRIVLGVYVVYLVELASGYALCKLLGRCPWDYGASPFAVSGYINLAYAPFWALLVTVIDLRGHK